MTEREDGLDLPWPEEGEADALWTLLMRDPPEGAGWEEDETLAWVRAVWDEARESLLGPLRQANVKVEEETELSRDMRVWRLVDEMLNPRGWQLADGD